jgi:hypothetical protein
MVTPEPSSEHEQSEIATEEDDSEVDEVVQAFSQDPLLLDTTLPGSKTPLSHESSGPDFDGLFTPRSRSTSADPLNMDFSQVDTLPVLVDDVNGSPFPLHSPSNSSPLSLAKSSPLPLTLADDLSRGRSLSILSERMPPSSLAHRQEEDTEMPSSNYIPEIPPELLAPEGRVLRKRQYKQLRPYQHDRAMYKTTIMSYDPNAYVRVSADDHAKRRGEEYAPEPEEGESQDTESPSKANRSREKSRDLQVWQHSEILAREISDDEREVKKVRREAKKGQRILEQKAKEAHSTEEKESQFANRHIAAPKSKSVQPPPVQVCMLTY